MESTEVGRPTIPVGSAIPWAWGKGRSKKETIAPSTLFPGLIQRVPTSHSILPPKSQTRFPTTMGSCFLKLGAQISHFFLSCFCQVFGLNEKKYREK